MEAFAAVGFADVAPQAILAHEFGHHIQMVLDSFKNDYLDELYADCFAGVYTRDADERGLLEDGDLEEALRGLIAAGDSEDTPWDSPSHGTPEQRAKAFADGYQNGLGRCLRPE